MNVVGKSINRVGGKGRVQGTQKYVGDYKLPGMLHAKLVTLECAHARILSIDTTAANKISGVQMVLTGEDIPKSVSRFGPAYMDRSLLAAGNIQYHGEPVAIVAAESELIAAHAASLVKVEYEKIPAISTVEQALSSQAELVQDPSIRAKGPFSQTNILNEWNFGWGDVDNSQADLIVENNYIFPMVTHFAIEPFAYLAEPAKDGLTMYSATQNPYQLQSVLARVLNMPLARVRVIAPDPGGAFGGKQHAKFEPVLAYLSQILGRPIRLELSLEESFQAVRRASAELHITSGFLNDGTIVFQDIESNYLVGAYADISARVVSKANYLAAGPYKIPNVRIKARAILSHTVPSTAFRWFGVPQINWGVESQIDEAAGTLGFDRIKIRLRNLPCKGEVFLPGDPPADGVWSELLEKASHAIGWDKPLPNKRGRGIALGIKMGATTASSYSIVRLHMDGSVTLFSGTSDMGQGARTVHSQIASEELGVPMEKVVMVMGDTSAVPFDLQTSASRSTVFMGKAIIKACDEIKRQIREMASEIYDVDIEILTTLPGVVCLPDAQISFEDILHKRFGRVKGEIIGVGSIRSEYLKDHPMGGHPAFYELVALASEVEVNEMSGEIQIHKLVVVGDVGKAINVQHVEMQDEGASVMGIGHTVMEQFILDDEGLIKNLGALDYRIPTIKDIPNKFTIIHVENHDGPGPYGAKGCAESGILAVSPSIAGAVEEAAGVRIRELPLTPERVWKAIQELKKE
jgi:CO/xanthine dehydrogenase Mo-binding subunit